MVCSRDEWKWERKCIWDGKNRGKWDFLVRKAFTCSFNGGYSKIIDYKLSGKVDYYGGC